MNPDTVRKNVFHGLRAIAAGRGADRRQLLGQVFAADVVWHGCHPFGRIDGIDALEARVFSPLHCSFPDLERRDDVFIAGHFQGDRWLSATGHYFGTFAQDWLGIPASRRCLTLRFGETYRLKGDHIAEAYVLYDIVDVMRQAGTTPLPGGRGIEGLAPGPRNHDGIRLAESPVDETSRTSELVMAMLRALFAPDRQSMGMERFWSADMMWYGPSPIGATRSIDGFFRDHQTPWMTAFPSWSDALDAPHFADGPYACYAGWPSIRATHDGPFCGLDPTGRSVDIRVMDWWRREDKLLRENWVLLDLPDLFLQLGVDLLAVTRESLANGRGKT